MITVTLSAQEMYHASLIGLRRRIASMYLGHSELRGLNRKGTAEKWYYNIVGAMGELAAAKAMGAYWLAGVNQKKSEPDVAPDWQIRTLARHDYDLIVRPDDADTFRYVLVTGDPPTFQVVGWIKGSDGKRPEWMRDRGDRNEPVYWVPQSELRSIG